MKKQDGGIVSLFGAWMAILFLKDKSRGGIFRLKMVQETAGRKEGCSEDGAAWRKEVEDGSCSSK